jgi:hypothetical protein
MSKECCLKSQTDRLPDEAGTALLTALMVTALLTTIGGVLAFMIVSETMISVNYRSACETLYAADAGIERAMADLRTMGDWSPVLAGAATSGFNDGTTAPRGMVDLEQRTTALQAESDARFGGVAANPNSPVWRLFAHAELTRVVPPDRPALPYVAVWVADDPADADGNPARDANGVLMLRAEAFGATGARRIVESTVGRLGRGTAEPRATIQPISWRQIR